jgi:hypothetical protein
MAYVKTRFSKSAAAKLKYIAKNRGDRDVVDAIGCNPETATENFENVRLLHNKNVTNECLHIVQSWSEEESALKTPEEFNAMGKRLAEGLYPGHQFVIRTHTDKNHIHNHIVLNTVNAETGKRIQNKKSVIHQTRAHSDKVCLENGLSVIPGREHSERPQLPLKVQQMVRYNRSSYLNDLAQKADFARQYATNLPEYQEALFVFGIRVRMTGKNITYFYPEREKGKRGSKLGKNYDKEGIDTAFRKNRELYQGRPELRAAMSDLLQQARMGKSIAPGTLNVAYNRSERGGTAQKVSGKSGQYPSEKALSNTPVPPMAVYDARRLDIPTYCGRNKIELTRNARGETVLKGREHIVIAGEECRNTRNGTRGTLIDFVAAHKNMTFLQAVAHLNNNPRLLLLEEHLGTAKRSYQSFYFPKEKRLEGNSAATLMASLMLDVGLPAETGTRLLSHGQAQVSKDRTIRLFPKDDDSHALEFEQNAAFIWKKRKVGNGITPFFKHRGGSNAHLVIFPDPISFLQKFGNLFRSYNHEPFDILCLMEPKSGAIDRHLAENRAITKVHLINTGRDNPELVDLFGNLKKKYAALGINLEAITDGRDLIQTLEKEGRSHGLNL